MGGSEAQSLCFLPAFLNVSEHLAQGEGLASSGAGVPFDATQKCREVKPMGDILAGGTGDG